MTRVVVVGAGFAGTNMVRALSAQMPRGCSLTLVSENSYTTFSPMLPEAVGASVFPEHVVVPVREMLPQSPTQQFIMGSVTSVDTQARRLTMQALNGEMTLPYDHLIFALGNRARLDLMPGMAEHALPLKTVGDAMHIRNTVLRRLACIELETHPERRRQLGHFIIVGGGFSGVEVAGELIDCLRGIRHYYPRVAADELKVTVLHGMPRLLPELPARLGAAALESLRQRGVTVRLDTFASSVSAAGVHLRDGELVAGDTVLGTIGTSSNPLLERIGVRCLQGRIVVNGDMSVPDFPGVWAVGDCAAVPNALDGSISPPTAQFAVRQAKHLAANLVREMRGRATEPFRYRSRGAMASIGHLKGVAEVLGVPLTGWLAWLVWRAYYLSQMPSSGRRLRIFFEWSWGMFFPSDITHLRFTRSAEVQSEDQKHHAEADAQALFLVSNQSPADQPLKHAQR